MATDTAIQAWGQRGAPRVPSAFPDGVGTVPNNPMVAAVLAAVLKGGPNARHLLNGWAPADDGRLVYRHIGKRGGEIRVYFDAHADGAFAGNESSDPGARQIALIESLNTLTADVMFMVLAQTCEPGLGNRAKFPLLDPVPVSANTMMKTKGFKSWGVERDRFRERIGAEIELLSRIRCDVIRFPGWDPAIGRWNPKGVSALGERLFEALPFDGGAETSASPRQDRVWLTRLGQWSQWWLNFHAKVWTCPVPQALVGFDHRTNRAADVMAKKVGLNTVMLWGAFRSRRRMERRIDHLLEDIGELPAFDERGHHWAGRTRDRFEEAMLRLQECGVLGQIEWDRRGSPGDKDRSKGWVSRWLATKICIYRPRAEAEGEYEDAGNGTRKTKNARRIQVLFETGGDIRAIRAKRYMSQKDLAKELRISPAFLSQIENGRKSMPDGMRERLSRIFESPEFQ
jgi:DNA-binding transcriptional regulator YiaG